MSAERANKSDRAEHGSRCAGAVIGTGIDLVEVARIHLCLKKWRDRFTRRVFLESERHYCESKPQPWMHYAVRFAVKEAVAKAFGTGISPELDWQDIEVIADPATRAPSVRFSPKGQALADRRGIARVLVSLSHTHDNAVAQAILVEDGNQMTNDGPRATRGKRQIYPAEGGTTEGGRQNQ